MSANKIAKDIFLSAIEITGQAERDAFVTGACRGEEALFQEVAELLEAHFQKDSWLDPRQRHPADGSPATESLEPPDSVSNLTAGAQIGNYKLLEQIGAGGMGIVFMAEQLKPIRRKVALKVIKPGMDTRQVIARFEAERQALALMDHPNVAHVLDAGATETGRPYFVMELVRGIPITEYCDKNRLTARERLKLFTSVCQAVQHAHSKGIIHRDIKPSNVLVTLHDGIPVPKIIDFGVAKATSQQLTERTLFTSFAQFVGTPLYMSPEQAEMSGLDVDTRSDIYSLGVLLYELLTGTTPFDRSRLHQAAIDEVRRIIREEEPPRPSTRVSSMGDASVTLSTQRSTDPFKLKQMLRRELDWIVMKTLEKDRTRRYETVNQLASEIQRYLDGQPVEACPPSTLYQLSKFAARHRTAVIVAACFFALIVGSTVLSLALYAGARHARDLAIAAQEGLQRERDHALEAERRAAVHLNAANQEKERADSHARKLEQSLYDYTIMKANSALRERDMRTVSSLLSECLPEQRGWEWSFLNRQANAPRSIKLPEKTNLECAISSDRTRIVLVDSEGLVRCLKFSDGSLLWSQKSEIANPSGSVISPNDQQYILTGSRRTKGSSEAGMQLEQGALQAFDMATGQLLWTQRPSCATTFLPSFCRDGSQFLVTVGDANSGSEIHLRSSADGNLIWATPAATIAQAIMSEDGTRIFVSETSSPRIQAPSVLRCLNAKDRSQLWKTTRSEQASSILLSPDESELLATGGDLSLILYDARTGEHKQTQKSSFKETGLLVLGCARGNHVVTVAAAGNFVIWDWQTKRPIEESKAISHGLGVRLTSDGSELAFLNSDSNLLHIRPVRAQSEALTLVGHKSGFKGARFLDNNLLCSVGNEGAWRVWQTATGQELSATPTGAQGLELETAPDATWVAAATTQGTKMWDKATGQLLQDWPQDGQAWFVKRNAAGTMLATAGQQGILRVYEAEHSTGTSPWSTKVTTPSREFKASSSIHGLAVTADGDTIYTLDSPGCELTAWDVKSGDRHILRSSQSGQMGRTAELSPDGHQLAIGVERAVEIWDLPSRKKVAVLRDAQNKVFSLCYDRSGSRLFAGTLDGTIVVWNVASRERLLNFKAHASYVLCLAMSPDNATLASSSFGGELKLWETQPLSAEVEARREIVQRATDRANRLLVQHRTPTAALEHLLKDKLTGDELAPTVRNILQARMAAPVNLNALSQITSPGMKPKPTRVINPTTSAHSLKEKIDAALGKNLPDLLTPTTEVPDGLESANWNVYCRTLIHKSSFNLEPDELIALLQQLKDNGDAPHYILYLKSIAHLQVAQWQEAEKEMSSAIAQVPARSPLWFTYAFRLAFLQAYVGQWDAYHKLCSEALENFKDSKDPLVLERLAKMCLFSEHGGGDWEAALDIADRAHAETEFLAPKIFERLTKGIADLRREKHDAALEHFRFVIDTGLRSDQQGHDIMVALAELYMAITLHHLGRHEDARQHLTDSAAVIHRFPPTSGWWPDWMMASTVLKEAEELIGENKQSAP